MKQKLHSLLLMVVLLSWSMVIAASDFDDGILKYTITSPSNLEVQCDGFTDGKRLRVYTIVDFSFIRTFAP